MPANIKVKLKLDGVHFDQATVERYADGITRTWLYQMGGALQKFSKNALSRRGPKNPKSRFGESVTTRYKSGKKKGQIRTFYRKGQYSAPGRPPFKRTGDPFNLSLIAFKVDMVSKSVYVGPLKTKGSQGMSRTVPNVHEFGGRVKNFKRRGINKVNINQTIFKKGKPLKKRVYKPRTLNYPERPYMYPSLVRGVKWFRARARRRF